MITALVLPTKTHDLLTILGEGTLLFLVLLIEAGPCLSAGTWKGRRISAKRYIAFCGLCTAILVLVAAAVVIKG